MIQPKDYKFVKINWVQLENIGSRNTLGSIKSTLTSKRECF